MLCSSFTIVQNKSLFLLINLLVSVVSMAPEMSLVSWNILASSYALPIKYPWSDPQDLDWTVREPRIIEKLASMDADVVCLQEVQVDLWQSLLSKLAKHGYHGVLQEMGRRHPVANAVLVREGLSIVRTESRSRALITVIMDDEHSSSPLYLANVHLDAGNTEESDVTRFNQIKSLCKRLQNQVSKDSHHDETVDEDPTIIIAGDCNMLRDSALHTLLRTGVVPTQDDDIRMTTNISTILPLTDVYLHHSPNTQQMTYRSGHVLDYIWISDTVECKITLPLDDEATTVGPKAWPSVTQPSDHIAIGALLTWSGAPILSTRNRSEWQRVQDDEVEDVLDPWTVSTTNRLDSTPNDRQ